MNDEQEVRDDDAEVRGLGQDAHREDLEHPPAGVYRGVLRGASLVEFPGVAGVRFELISAKLAGRCYQLESWFGSEPGGSLWRVLANWRRLKPDDAAEIEALHDSHLLLPFVGQQADVLVHTYDTSFRRPVSFVADLAPPGRHLRQRRSDRWYRKRPDWLLVPRLERLVF